MALPTDLGPHPGYAGMFTRNEVPGMLPNKTRIKKVNSEANDATKDGTQGVVHGSIYAPEVGGGYFIEWDDKPRIVIFCIDLKVARLHEVGHHGSA